VVCSPVYTAADVYKDPYFRERGLLIEYDDPVHGTVTAPGVVPKLTTTPGRVRSAAQWSVGEDTAAVLHDLGLDDKQVEQLRGDGVI
jgi:crotonobetainyl-CoA:carnitine CoA-transferase CaiB-like acyl-CoA transferase